MSVKKYKNRIMALATIIALGTFSSSFATAHNNSTNIQFVGNSNELPVFQLELKNNEPTVYFITIRNRDKKILWSEKLKGTKILRRYKLQAHEPELVVGTTFEITNRETKETTRYEFSGQSILKETASDFQAMMTLITAD